MNSERYQKIYEIFSEAQELPFEQRAGFLDKSCGGDAELRAEIESFLESEENIGDFIEAPAIEVAAKIIADDQTISRIGREIGHYKIVSLLGAGGMGEVWLAEDVRLKRKVALKLLSAVHKMELLARFEQEAHAISSLNHPNIITIFDVGQSDGWEYIATEYIDGKTLRRLINENELTLTQSVKIATQVSTALAAAHSAGIVHRDIKPENIMVRADGIAKVLDFGLARFSDENLSSLNEKLKTAPGMVMGTVTYMSPEQARGHSVDEKTDVFSLGIVLYEMLTGKQPFEGESGIDVLAAILKYEPQPLGESCPESLRRIIGKSLEKDSSKRPAMAEILSDFQAINLSEEIPLEAGNQTADRRYGNQTVGLTALTDKNPRRKTDNFVAVGNARRAPFYKIAAAIVLLLAVIASALAFYSYRGKDSAAVILTENDPLLLADFENKTGDKDFDDKVFDQLIYTGLHQSPYILLTNYNDVAEKLKELGKTPLVPLTDELAEEIGRRLNGKAVLKGSIENDASKYRIVFEAVDPATGESLAKEQAEAGSKETVIDALDMALTAMRLKLGEPLNSVKAYTVALRAAQSSSIPALKLFSLAAKTEYDGKHEDAIVLYKRALEADPNYVFAYYSIAVIYSENGQEKQAKEYMEKAFALSRRLSERDKPEIENFYYDYVTGEIDKEIENYENAKKLYPREYTIPINLGDSYLKIGDRARAEENYRTALKLFPKTITPRIQLGETLIKQSRFEEARSVYQEAATLGADGDRTSPGLFMTAFALDNEAEMQRQLDLLKEAGETERLWFQAAPEIYGGKASDYVKLMDQAIDRAAKAAPGIAGKYSAQAAVNLAALGKCAEAENWAKRALTYDREQTVLTNVALVSAVCSDKPQPLIDELEEKFPQSTIVQNIWLPIIRAAAEMKDSPEKALETLEVNRQYETVTAFWGNYLRGQVYLKMNKPDAAAKEFQKILENRGWAIESPLCALAHLEIAKAYEMRNDAANAVRHRAQFAALWKNADKDLPVLKGIAVK